MQKYKMPISRLRMMVCLIGMLLPMCMFAQQITVQGVVKDQTGETVIGASVMEKGTTNGTITGIDGDFSLNMSPNGTLVVSFVGYKTQEVQVKGQKQLQVVLSEDAEMLDEVVVIGYGTMKKSDLTGAVSSIGNKDIKDSPVSNLGQAIQGKISGVQIVDAGKPGDNVSIKIRGLGSINNCDPLVVIDGVPTDLGLSSLNMADVERLDVLKDASATAIYGSRGANGVVMITTGHIIMGFLVTAGITYRIVLHHTRTEQFIHPVGTCTQFRRIGPFRIRIASTVHHHVITQLGILRRVQ